MLRKIRMALETIVLGESRDITAVRQHAQALLKKHGTREDRSTWRDIVVTEAVVNDYRIRRFQAWGEMWADNLDVIHIPSERPVFVEKHEKNFIFFRHKSESHHKNICKNDDLIRQFLALN